MLETFLRRIVLHLSLEEFGILCYAKSGAGVGCYQPAKNVGVERACGVWKCVFLRTRTTHRSQATGNPFDVYLLSTDSYWRSSYNPWSHASQWPDIFIDLRQNGATTTTTLPTTSEPMTTLEWDWDIEHADRKLEAKADAEWQSELPFQVDRKVLKDVVRERMGLEVGRIHFLSLGMSIENRAVSALRISLIM